MVTKGKVFRGSVAADLRPAFRADVFQLALLPEANLQALANILVEDAKSLVPTKANTLAHKIATELHVPVEQSQALARGGRSLSSQMARADDNAADLADDLVSLEIVPQERRQAIYAFLAVIQRERSHFVARSSRLEITTSGGYHLTSVAAFTDLRAIFAESDYSKIDVAKYVPKVVGFLPTLTLELEIHRGDETTKSIAIRLTEEDLTNLENVLNVARVELAAVKQKAQGAQQ